MKFIKVHSPHQSPMHVNVAAIVTVQAIEGGSHIVTLAGDGQNSWRFNVTESTEEILTLIANASSL